MPFKFKTCFLLFSEGFGLTFATYYSRGIMEVILWLLSVRLSPPTSENRFVPFLITRDIEAVILIKQAPEDTISGALVLLYSIDAFYFYVVYTLTRRCPGVLWLIWTHLLDCSGRRRENMCSCGYSSERYWTNYNSSNIFPAEKVYPGVTPQRAKLNIG